MSVQLELLDRLRGVCEAKGWDLEKGSIHLARFDRIVNIMSHLEPVAQELLVALTADFLVHDLAAYDACVVGLLDDVLGDAYAPDSGDPLVILPLIKEKDVGVPKSGAMVAYLVRAELDRRGVKHRSWDRPQLVAEKFGGRHNACVLIVDDFIGSGESAEDAYNFYRAVAGNATDRVVVCSLVAQQVGLDFLWGKGIPARTVVIRHRGISDSHRLPDIPSALATMDGIEDLMGVPADYRRGYKATEALLSMIRCPNNTFPIYWMRPRGDLAWEAPFTR